VSEGTRTPDRRDHNPELYQLSYAHRGAAKSTSGPPPRRRDPVEKSAHRSSRAGPVPILTSEDLMLTALAVFAVLIALWGLTSRGSESPADPSGPETA
jgi:hypothetical protein